MSRRTRIILAVLIAWTALHATVRRTKSFQPMYMVKPWSGDQRMPPCVRTAMERMIYNHPRTLALLSIP